MRNRAEVSKDYRVDSDIDSTLSLSSQFQNEEFSPFLFVVVVVVFFVARKFEELMREKGNSIEMCTYYLP